MKKALCLVAMLALAASPARTADGPGLLLVPLLAASSPEEWYGPTLDRILEEKIRSLKVFEVAGGEKKDEALRFLSTAEKIDTDVLSEAVELGGADFAVVGQFSADGGKLVMDLRVFSPATMEQTASFQLEGPLEDAFSIMTEGALFVAQRFGITVTDEMKAAVGENQTTSLEAYRTFHEARVKSETADQVTLLLEAVRLDPRFIEANVRLALALHHLGRTEEAVEYLEKAAELRPEVPETFNNLAVLYAQLERRKDALAAFERALELKPDYPEARLNYGRLLEESGRYDQAEGVYLDLLEEDRENVKARSSLALLYERTGRTELAVQEFRVLSRTSPDLAEEFFLSRGKDARKAREYKKAERFFQRAVDINPQYAQGYAELGTNSFLAGNYEKSMEQFLQALALEPQRGEFHHYLGLAQEKLGLRDEARASFLRSIEVGGPAGSHLQLARIYLAEGKSSKAADELNLILADDPGHAEARDLLARAMARSEADQKKDQERAAFATRRLERLESIIEDLTDTNRKLENRLLALQAEGTEAERELQRLRGERGQRVEDLEGRLKEMEEEKARREAEFGRRMEEALRSIEELSAGEEMENLRNQYLQQVSTLEQELAEARMALAEAERMRMPDTDEIGRELANERRKVANLENALAEAKSDHEKAAADRNLLAAEVKNWKEREAVRAREYEELEKRFDVLSREKEKEGKELTRLQERNRGLESKTGDLERELGEARRELKSLRNEAESLREESGRSVRSAAGLKERASFLEDENRDLEKERDSLRRSYDTLLSESADLERALAETRAELDELRRNVDKDKDALASRYDEKEEDLKASLAREQGLRDERDRLEGEKASLESRLAVAVTELEAVRQDVAVGSLEEKRLREAEQDLLDERDRLEEEKASLESRLAVAVTELEASRQDVAVSSLAEDRLREAEKDLLVERGRLEKRISELEGRLAAESDGRAQAERAEQSLRAEFDGLRRQVLELSLELGELLMQERSWAKAAQAYERVLVVNPAMAEAYYRLGEIYFQLGRFDESKKMYQKAGESY